MNDQPRPSAPRDDRDDTYQSVLQRLQARGRFGMRLGLARTRALLRALGNPERSVRGVLIGGTNGKGSSQAIVATALRAAGYRTGQSPKPHLVSYRERIVVDGQPIEIDDFGTLLDEVMAANGRLEQRHGPSTEFEILTAAAFLHFARRQVDVGVIEVGIGGRLDATNVWQGGVSAITNVALDHLDVLGETVARIAAEKAQIIKRGDTAAVTGADEPGLGVIRRRAARVAVPLVVVEPFELLHIDRNGTQLRMPDGTRLEVGLIGAHQAANAAVAWHILDALASSGIATVGVEQRLAAFAAVRWPGRMELINRPGAPSVLLDGAHNPHGVAALADTLRVLLPQLSGGPPTVLMGVLANHWQPGMIDPLAFAMPGATVIATVVPGSTNSFDPARLALEWGPGGRAIVDPDAALAAAQANSRNSGGLLIVCGSLYLVGYVRSQLLGSSEPAR